MSKAPLESQSFLRKGRGGTAARRFHPGRTLQAGVAASSDHKINQGDRK